MADRPVVGRGRTITIVVDLRRAGATYAAAGSGAERVTGLVVTELLIASRTGRLRRLKTCANHV